MIKDFRLALDWTPNTNHIGFLMAFGNGIYKQHDINLKIINPKDEHYAETPAKKVELNKADAALCPTESLISYRSKSKPFPLKAVAAIYQSDVSAICTLKSSGVQRPKDLDGKIYASYHARYEDKIVRQMIKNDGGEGHIKIDYPDKLGIWNTLLSKKADATWIFSNWEGIQAKNKKVKLNFIRMADYGIPYSYSPVIAIDENKHKTDKDLYRRFIQASKQGFLEAMQHPQQASEILAKYIPDDDQDINLEESIIYSAEFIDFKNWGKMRLDEVNKFLDWIYEHHLETQQFSADDIVTNELLD
jgi:ABC-type nitrate/sulfonate/bicarbonate transport system substrate-binding protein